MKLLARIIKNGVGQVLRVRGRVRRAKLWSLLQILLLLGPVVLAKPPSTLILKRECEDVVVVVSEEELEPGPRETRCVTKDGEVDCQTHVPIHAGSGSAGSPQPPTSVSPKTPGSRRNATTSRPCHQEDR